MAEDTRLKHSKEMLYIKNQSNNQSNQPQHPQQTIHTEKLLKETDDCNNIDYYNGHFTADCFRVSFVIRKGWDIETEWWRTQKTQDWRQDLQLWKGETHFKEVDYQIQQD